MFFWFIYLITSLFISSVLSKVLTKKYNPYIFVLIFFFLVTPAAIEVREGILSPAIFRFFYDILFEIGLSFSTLRPLLLSLPMSLLVTFLVIQLKRRFF